MRRVVITIGGAEMKQQDVGGRAVSRLEFAADHTDRMVVVNAVQTGQSRPSSIVRGLGVRKC